MNLAEQWDAIPVNSTRVPPGVQMRIPAGVQAQRDAEAGAIRAREALPNGGGAIPTSSVIGTPAPSKMTLADEWDSIPATKPQAQPKPQSFDPMKLETPGVADAALSAVTGAGAAVAGQLAGVYETVTSGKFGTQEGIRAGEKRAKEVMEALTWKPRTDAGKAILQSIDKVASASKLEGLGPPEAITLGAVASGMRAPKVSKAPESVPTGALGSAGAAGANPIEQARAIAALASPETRAIVERAAKKGDAINLDALKRISESESLPVRVDLTPGQATRDIVRLSEEQNLRGKETAFAQRFQDQNKALIENTNMIRETAAPDVYVNSKPDIGNMVIDAYKAKDDALNTQISAKYQALRDANGGAFPLDAKAFVTTADKALHKGLLYDFVPGEVRKTLDRVKSQGMTFENFEALRTNLARIQRSPSADGNAKAAAGVIRDALEEMPMPKGAEHLKPLADSARAAARDRFQMIEKDPAYKAVVKGSASADKFINDFVLKKDVKSVETMWQNLTPEAQQAVRAGVINQLKESARITDNQGNFSQAGYNKALESIKPKLGVIFDAKERQQLEALGNVARYTQEQPRGSFVNNSNTLVGALAEGAKSSLEAVANWSVPGLQAGTWAKDKIQQRARRKKVEDALKPGKGILLKDIGK